jgi:hypothetical protein
VGTRKPIGPQPVKEPSPLESPLEDGSGAGLDAWGLPKGRVKAQLSGVGVCGGSSDASRRNSSTPNNRIWSRCCRLCRSGASVCTARKRGTRCAPELRAARGPQTPLQAILTPLLANLSRSHAILAPFQAQLTPLLARAPFQARLTPFQTKLPPLQAKLSPLQAKLAPSQARLAPLQTRSHQSAKRRPSVASPSCGRAQPPQAGAHSLQLVQN